MSGAARWRGVVLGAVACVVGLFMAEVAARVVQAPMLYYKSPQVRYQPHAVRSFTLRPCQSRVYSVSATVDIDCQGFRANGPGENRGGSPVILALGDSFTFGLGVENHETWPARLETRLREGGCPAARVFNAGTISYGVFQEYDLLLDHVARTKPTVVIHGLYWNDYQSAHLPRPGRPPILTPDGFFVWDNLAADSWFQRASKWVLGHSSLATLAHHTGRRLGGRPPAAGDEYAAAYEKFVRGQLDPTSLAPIVDFYRRFQALGREHSFLPYVVVVPAVNVLEPGGGVENPYRRFVVDQLDTLKIPYLDGYALWVLSGLGSSTFLPQGPDAHLSASGYRVLAEALAARLLQPRSLESCPIGR